MKIAACQTHRNFDEMHSEQFPDPDDAAEDMGLFFWLLLGPVLLILMVFLVPFGVAHWLWSLQEEVFEV